MIYKIAYNETLVYDFVGFKRGDLSTAGLNVKCVSDPKEYRPQRLEQCVMRIILISWIY